MTPDDLKTLLEYDPDTGALTWKERPLSCFTTKASWARFHAVQAGRPAVGHKDTKGRLRIRLGGKNLYVHRVAWALTYGQWPSQIDHISGDTSDNRLANLREVTDQENQRNRSRPSNNTSGHVGVYWDNRRNRWLARIRVGSRLIYIRSFIEKADALRARREAEIKLGFHPNHGRP